MAMIIFTSAGLFIHNLRTYVPLPRSLQPAESAVRGVASERGPVRRGPLAETRMRSPPLIERLLNWSLACEPRDATRPQAKPSQAKPSQIKPS